MKYTEYIVPLVLGIIFVFLSFVFSEKVSLIFSKESFSSDLFGFSSILFGLLLTAYAILFGLVPSLNKSFRKSTTLKEINFYFKFCLTVLLLEIIFSLVYMFETNFVFFLINIFLIGVSIGMFGYIILLINDLFNLATQEE